MKCIDSAHKFGEIVMFLIQMPYVALVLFGSEQ